MKSRVNLFPDTLRPKLKLYNLAFVIVIWLLFAATVFLLMTEQRASSSDYKQQLTSLEQGYQQQQNRESELQAALEAKGIDQRLQHEVDQLKQKIAVKQRLQGALKQYDPMKQRGFSGLMFDLAKYHHPQLWLSQFSVDQNNIRFVGFAEGSSAVPTWLSQLAQSTFFSGQTFEETKLYRDTEQRLNFVINSRWSATEKTDGAGL